MKVGGAERNQGFMNIIGMAELSLSLKLTSGLSIHKGHLIPLLFKAKLSWILCLLTSKVLIQVLASERPEFESQLSPLIAVWSWTNHWASLSLFSHL